MNDIAPLIATTVIFYFAVAFTRLLLDHRFRTRLLLTQADMHGRLLDRIGTGPDALQYLKGGSGLELLNASAFEPDAPRLRILGSLQAGIVIALSGLACLLLRGTFQDADTQSGLAFLGGLALAVGIGFVASAAVAHRLSRAWGLFGERGSATSNLD